MKNVETMSQDELQREAEKIVAQSEKRREYQRERNRREDVKEGRRAYQLKRREYQRAILEAVKK